MKILVTGSSGFIGKYLVRRLETKHEVIGYDIKNLFNVTNLKGLKIVSKGADVIVHLAALVDERKSFEKPLEYFLTNLLGTINVLEVARKLGAKVIFASSAGIFQSHSPYTISKKQGEYWCKFYRRYYKTNVHILRFFNVYGKYNDKGVIYEFMKRIKEGKTLTINGDGHQVRDYVHVSDVVKVIEDFIEGSKTDEIYEVGTGIGTSVNELVDLLKEMTKKSIKTKHKPLKYPEARYSICQSPLEDYVGLEEGLKELIE